MSTRVEKINSIIDTLMKETTIEGVAVVTTKGQLIAATLRQGADEKAVSAMTAALASVGNRVGSVLGVGNIHDIMIQGENKIVDLRSTGGVYLLALAPADEKIGLLDYELSKATEELTKIL